MYFISLPSQEALDTAEKELHAARAELGAFRAESAEGTGAGHAAEVVALQQMLVQARCCCCGRAVVVVGALQQMLVQAKVRCAEIDGERAVSANYVSLMTMVSAKY